MFIEYAVLVYKYEKGCSKGYNIYDKIRCINNLMPEQKTIKENSSYALYTLPQVQLYVLEILSSRHVDTKRAQRALDELQVLVHHD